MRKQDSIEITITIGGETFGGSVELTANKDNLPMAFKTMVGGIIGIAYINGIELDPEGNLHEI